MITTDIDHMMQDNHKYREVNESQGIILVSSPIPMGKLLTRPPDDTGNFSLLSNVAQVSGITTPENLLRY